MTTLLLDDGTPFTGKYICNQCPAQTKHLKTRIRECYQDEPDYIPTDDDYELHGSRPYQTQSKQKFLNHLADKHYVSRTDMSGVRKNGLNGYIGTNYSNILNTTCSICGLTFNTVMEFQKHVTDSASIEIKRSKKRGDNPLKSKHFTQDRIVDYVEKISAQKLLKADGLRRRREGVKSTEPVYTTEQLEVEAECVKQDKADNANTCLSCKVCGTLYTRKNWKQHCRSKKHTKIQYSINIKLLHKKLIFMILKHQWRLSKDRH